MGWCANLSRPTLLFPFILMSEVKFCKEFLQQISKLPVEYPEGYIERRRGPVARPSVSKPTPAAPKPNAPAANGFKVALKKLGGVGKAHEVSLSPTSTVSELRTEAGRLFSSDNFTLMYKGRPLSDESAKVSSLVDDLSTAIYVSIKSGAKPVAAVSITSGESLTEEFWIEFGKLLGKHVSQPSATKLQTRFRQEYSKWL